MHFFFSFSDQFIFIIISYSKGLYPEVNEKMKLKKAVNWYFNCTDTGFEIPAANQSYNIYREMSNRDISLQAFNWNPNEITLLRCGMPEACT